MTHKFVFLCLLCVVHAFGNSDDRFFKKYATMKVSYCITNWLIDLRQLIYESCFGPEVVKQIRKEMKNAYIKCSAPPSFEEAPNSHVPPIFLGKLPPGFSMDPNTQTITKPTDGAVQNLENDNNLQDQGQHPPKSSTGNIFAFRPHQGFPQQQPNIPPYMLPVNPQFRPFSGAAPFYQFPYNAPGMYYPPGPQYSPYTYQQMQQAGFYHQPYFGSNRMSREMDLRDRLDIISRGPQADRARNITCVMQELGYIDRNLEPNYEQITQRIANLPVSSELKGDIQDGLQFCQKFAKCLPDVKRDMAPISQDLVKPMFFFRCYKHKKLEACIMKDIRDRFHNDDDLDTDTDFRSLTRSARSIRDDPMSDPRFEALDEMAVYLYDYLSRGSGFDFDMYM